MRKVLFLILFVSKLSSAQIIFNSSKIPVKYQSYANVVMQDNHREIEIKSEKEYYLRVRQTFTILNESGKSFQEVGLLYKPKDKIKSLSLVLYDGFGNVIKKAKESDFKDVAYYHDFSLFEDIRLKYFSPVITSYPCTLTFEYELKLSNTLSFPDWRPKSEDGVSIIASDLIITKPSSYQLRYWSQFLDKPQTSSSDNVDQLKWSFNDQAATKQEPLTKPDEERLPILMIAPVNFNYENLSGSFINWKEYGQWTYQNLLAKSDFLSPETVQSVKELVKDAPTKLDSAKRIYEFMQNKCRYISVQVGIGGFKPVSANEVDHLGYGDCKGLVNYTRALLKAVGINAIYTEVMAGEEQINYKSDFASASQGNHIILCLPLQQDTVWMECTSKTIPFGFLGDFTDNRNVLLITPEGGKLAKTPAYSYQKNKIYRANYLKLDNDGNLTGNLKSEYTSLMYQERDFLNNYNEEERNRYLIKKYPVNNLEIENYQLKLNKEISPVCNEYFDFNARNYASKSGDRLFFSLNPFFSFKNNLKEVRNRQNEVLIRKGYIERDSIQIEIPDNYKIEVLASAKEYTVPMGIYTLGIKVLNDKIYLERTFVLKEGIYPSDTYDQLLDFYNKIENSDIAKCILIKK